MFASFWRWLRNRSGKSHRAAGRPLYRPRMELLEGRELPAVVSSGFLALAPLPNGLGVPMQFQSTLPVPPASIPLTVVQNSPDRVVDLGAVFATVPGLQHEDGLQFTVLSNSNPSLVRTDLSGASLTVTFLRGQCGSATIVVAGTDADGISVRQTFQITVTPLSPPGANAVIPTQPPMPMPPPQL